MAEAPVIAADLGRVPKKTRRGRGKAAASLQRIVSRTGFRGPGLGASADSGGRRFGLRNPERSTGSRCAYASRHPRYPGVIPCYPGYKTFDRAQGGDHADRWDGREYRESARSSQRGVAERLLATRLRERRGSPPRAALTFDALAGLVSRRLRCPAPPYARYRARACREPSSGLRRVAGDGDHDRSDSELSAPPPRPRSIGKPRR